MPNKNCDWSRHIKHGPFNLKSILRFVSREYCTVYTFCVYVFFAPIHCFPLSCKTSAKVADTFLFDWSQTICVYWVSRILARLFFQIEYTIDSCILSRVYEEGKRVLWRDSEWKKSSCENKIKKSISSGGRQTTCICSVLAHWCSVCA